MSHGVGRGTELHQVGKPQTLWINSIQFAVLIMANTKVYQSGCEGVPSLFFLYDVWTWFKLIVWEGVGPLSEGWESQLVGAFVHPVGPEGA